jgi:FAD/FMN-containing dehydrogenase
MAAFGLDPADAAVRGPWLIVSVDHVGTPHTMNNAIAPLLACPGRVADFDFGRLHRGIEIPALRRQSRYIAEKLRTHDWERMLDLFATAPDRLTTLYVQAQGGAVNAAPRDSSAFVHRDADLLTYMDVFWHDREEREVACAFQDRWTAMVAPFWNGHSYQNFSDPELADYRAAYWGDAFAALLAVKQKYDPANLFRSPQMIAPHSGHATPDPVWPPLVVDALRQAIQR